jgi:hypothetical protein
VGTGRGGKEEGQKKKGLVHLNFEMTSLLVSCCYRCAEMRTAMADGKRAFILSVRGGAACRRRTWLYWKQQQNFFFLSRDMKFGSREDRTPDVPVPTAVKHPLTKVAG